MKTDELFKQAFEDHQRNRIAAAKAGYEEVLKCDPHHPSALHLKGLIAFDAGDIEAALDLVEQSIRLAGTNRQWLLNYGKILSRAGKLEEAIGVYYQVQALAPDCVEAKTALADLYGTVGEHHISLLWLFRLLSDDPENGDSAAKYVNTLRTMGWDDVAAEFLVTFQV
ncbi:MAG: tetratricopeptide repeat protein [Thermodesulfobacteriota bacterium]|nr:tetratricopeptide repeat protein [Thermodesulfobacteriota bacterium]